MTVEVAIMHGARAGKLRAFVRNNRRGSEDDGLAGLLRLADKESTASANALGRVLAAASVGQRG